MVLMVGYDDYAEVTIFDELSETLPQHRAEVALDFRQPWGEAGVGIEASQFLHDAWKNRLTLGDVSPRTSTNGSSWASTFPSASSTTRS